MRRCGKSLLTYARLQNASRVGSRVLRQRIRAEHWCFYQELDSRFRGNDTPFVVPAQAGTQIPWSRRLSLSLLFAFCFLPFAFSSFALAAPYVYVTNEKSDDVSVIDAAT